MITLAAVGTGSEAAAYYANDNYYTAGEAAGASAWMGEGAALLGLAGPVETDAFAQVLDGKLPDGSVIAQPHGEHRAGLDLTFSASKSVSLVAMLGGDARVVEALTAAVKATIGWTEKNLAEARHWNGQRQDRVVTGNLIAATFLHDVNRENEPQLHVHAVLANATRRPDGQWRALNNDELFKRQHVIGTVFNTELRHRIEALGYRTVPAENPIDGSFDIAGVPRDAIEAFSTRSAQIIDYLAATGRRGTAAEREVATLATRKTKTPDLDREVRGREWAARACARAFDPARVVGEAVGRSGRGETVWRRLAEGARGIGAKGMALAAGMGLTPRDGDPLVPERLGRLDPIAFATAQAVASAARELSEREAAFGRLDLLRAALERGGPVGVGDVEARIDLLAAKGRLIGDSERMLTTEGAMRLERDLLARAAAGRGQGTVFVPSPDAAARAQQAARELELHRLNAGQERAAALMLSSRDRVVAVQGGAGVGKSAALAPVTRVLQAEGVTVLGLTIAAKLTRKLAADTGAETSTVAGFLTRHRRILDGTASPRQLAEARGTLGNALVFVDESSMVGTATMHDLVRLGEALGLGRLVLVGDTRQIAAIDAGKPFAQLQADGRETAIISENLRARSETMKGVVAALDAEDLPRAFEILGPVTTEVPRDQVPVTAAKLWAALPAEERERTLLLASGRAMRGAANAAAQAELQAKGEIARTGIRLDVLDRATVTREAARSPRPYQPGRLVELRTDLRSQRLARGDRGVVVGVEGGKVLLRMPDGRVQPFRPYRLPRNLKSDAVTIHAVKQIALHEGDRIRWTDNDRERGLFNADLARVEAITARGVTVSTLTDGVVHELARGDRMLERLDLAYAVNVHVAQGLTADHGIVMMSAREGPLASKTSFLVAVTRIADKATLVVDDALRLQRTVQRNPGTKTAALEVAANLPEKALNEPEPGRSRDYGMEM